MGVREGQGREERSKEAHMLAKFCNTLPINTNWRWQISLGGSEREKLVRSQWATPAERTLKQTISVRSSLKQSGGVVLA